MLLGEFCVGKTIAEICLFPEDGGSNYGHIDFTDHTGIEIGGEIRAYRENEDGIDYLDTLKTYEEQI